MAANDQDRPAVAWGGSSFLVVWEDERNALPANLQYEDLYGARVVSDGSVLDAAGIGICTNMGPQFRPCVAGNGQDGFLVAWRDYRNPTPPYPSDIYGSRVSGAGVVLDPAGIAISTATDFQFGSAIAFGAGSWFVAWEDNRNGTYQQVYGTRVNTSGTVLDAAGVRLGNGATNQLRPAVAWGTNGFLCVWEDGRNVPPLGYGHYRDIYGARVSSAGVNLDPANIAIATNAAWQTEPALAWTGESFLCLWEDGRRAPVDLRGTRVDTAGNVMDGVAEGFVLHGTARRRLQPCIAARSNGMALVAYASPEIGTYNADRIYASLLDMALRPITLSTAPGNQVTITVSNTYPDRIYDVVATPGLTGSPTWTPLGFDYEGNGGVLTFPVTPAGPAAFYRVTATPR